MKNNDSKFNQKPVPLIAGGGRPPSKGFFAEQSGKAERDIPFISALDFVFFTQKEPSLLCYCLTYSIAGASGGE